MKKMSLVLSAGVLALTSNVMAASYSSVCNGCTPAQTREMVQGSRTGDYFVYDMINRKVTHWAIGTGKDIDHLPITQAPITPSVQNQFNAVQALYDVSRTLEINLSFVMPALTKVTSVSGMRDATVYQPMVNLMATANDNRMSAFDLINTPANQQAAIDAMQKQQGWLSSVPSQLQAGLATFVNHFTLTQAIYPVPVVIRVTLQFPDGSSSRVFWNVSSTQWEYEKGSSRDPVGNPIPENPDQAAGGAANRQNYVFPSTSDGIGSALRQSQNFGRIGLPVGAPVFKNGSTWTIACVRVGGVNGTVNCTAVSSR